MKPIHPLLTVAFSKWIDLVRLSSRLSTKWVFRGQSDFSWPLQSSFDRYALNKGVPTNDRRLLEATMLREFQRSAYRYLDNKPDAASYVDWLATMQHFGAPTRLIDFSHSIFVALFFASHHDTEDGAIWAVNTKKLKLAAGDSDDLISRDANQALEKRGYSGQLYLNELANGAMEFQSPGRLVLPVEPEIRFSRIEAQQGLFLFPLDLSTSFENNILHQLGFADYGEPLYRPEGAFVHVDDELIYESIEHHPVIKIRLSSIEKKNIRTELRKMNLTDASLFPGIDGVARSMQFLADTYRSDAPHGELDQDAFRFVLPGGSFEKLKPWLTSD